MVKLHVENSYTKILELTDLEIIDKISKILSYKEDFIPFSKRSYWDGTHRLLTRKLQFPTGCLDRVVEFLVNNQIEFVIDDKRPVVQLNKEGLSWTGHDLYPYQEEIVDICLDKKTGMVKSCTGSGKSLIISRIVYECNLPTVIYVVSTDLLHQMHNTLSNSLNVPIGIVGAGNCDIQKITVCSAWTAGKAFNQKVIKADEEVQSDNWSPSQEQRARIREMVQSAQLCILDEAQFAAAESIKVILSKSVNASYRLGLSGTPWRGFGDDILLEAAFGQRICDVSASYLIKLGYLVPGHFVFKDIPKLDFFTGNNFRTIKKEYIVENRHRNKILVNSAIKLMDLGRKPLMLFREHKHGEALANILPSDVNFKYVTGKLSADERNQIREDFSNGKVDLILASTVYDQGVDLPALDALINCGGGKSTAKALQRVGRVIRGNKKAGKKDAIIVDTFDQAQHLRKHSYLRYEIYNTEEAFKFKIPKNFESYIKRMAYGKNKRFNS